MHTNDIVSEIRDANLSYLMLAQQMIRADKSTAIFRLGLSEPIASMLTRFRFEDATILGMLTHDSKDRALAQSHAAILLAGQTFHEVH